MGFSRYIFLVPAAVALLLSPFLLVKPGTLKARKVKRRFEVKGVESVILRGMSMVRLLRPVFPKEGTKRCEKFRQLLHMNGYTSIELAYLIKLCLPLLVFAVSALITYTNIRMDVKTMMSDLNYKNNPIFFNRKDIVKDEKQAINNEIKMFELIKGQFSKARIKDVKNKKEITLEISEIIKDHNIRSFEDISSVSHRIYNKVFDFYTINEVPYTRIAGISLLFFFAPNLYLRIRILLKRFQWESEIILLERITILTGKIEPIKASEIVEVLVKNSRVYRPFLRTLELHYLNNRLSARNSYDAVKALVPNLDFKLLCETLRDAETIDMRNAISNLEENAVNKREFRKIREDAKMQMKEILGMVFVLLPLIYVFAYLLRPWEVSFKIF